ncbi:MAG: hypothetical protein Q7R92_04475 [bacterium]|nr:hypothetical protein [bacterium]
MTKKILYLGILVSFLMMPIIVIAATPPAIPLAVYGNVKIDSALAPVGAVITVFNGAAEVARATTTQIGKYFLEVPAINAGLNLTYKVNGAAAAEKIAVNPASQASDKIDLAVTAPAASAPVPAPATSSGTSSSGGSGSTGSSGGGANNSASAGGSAPTTATAPAPTASQTSPSLPPRPAPPQVLGVKIASAAEIQLKNILTESAAVWAENIETILNNAKTARDAKAEKTTADKYLSNLTRSEKSLASADANRLNFFITYGTAGTKILGAGERAGVLSSYKAAFGQLPKNEIQWQDALKIASGRWPAEKNSAAETLAKTAFKKIYLREADMAKPNDNASVTVMAYGLRPSARNLNSEKAAINSFKFIYKRVPASAVDWDAVRAIAYSGAKR